MLIESPIRSIRLKCLDCMCNQPKEVALCPCTDCPLWGYRFGKRPTEEIAATFKAAKPLPWLQEIYDNRQKRREQAQRRIKVDNVSSDCLDDD